MTAPRLLVQALSDSFAAVWPTLAADAGFALEVVVGSLGPIEAESTVVLLAGGGEERSLVGASRELAAQGAVFCAVASEADYRLATNVLRAGADQLFVLPQDMELLRSWLKEHADRMLARRRQRAFAEGQVSKFRFQGIFGTSAALVQALERAARIIPHAGVTVLLTGETGTGKELFARAIHYNGPRSGAPFVDINCAALPENLLESELFGHEKGAFTGATVSKPGLFEMADGGTVFLDEIGHLALPLQAKLLRALQEKTIRHVGGTRPIPVDVRIIAATHVDLEQAVRAREFREDLFYRLNVVPIMLPPLRQRRDDILPLARHFLERFADEYGVPVPTFSSAAMRALMEREWPGNIRELRNVIERAVLLADTATIDASHLELETHAAAAPGGIPFPATLGAVINATVLRTMEACGGNKSESARRLGISRTRLQRILDGEHDESGDASTAAAPALTSKEDVWAPSR